MVRKGLNFTAGRRVYNVMVGNVEINEQYGDKYGLRMAS